MKIIGFVGMPGSGKSVAADVAREMNVPVVVMGDVIREEAALQNLSPTDQNLGRVGNHLREEEGPTAIAARCLKKIEREADRSRSPLVVVEGIRSKDEVDFFRERSENFRLVEVWVPGDIRMARIASRGRSDDASGDELSRAVSQRDARELGWGMGDAIRSADIRIENAGTVEEFRAKAKELLGGYTDVLVLKENDPHNLSG